jgi:hypothetical protein
VAGDWIKMRTNLDTDPAVVRIASGLKTDRFTVVGRLHKIWAWANEHLTDGRDVPIDSEFLDALVESPGFSEQLRRVGWLTGRDGSLCFPSFERHNGASAKQRALDAARKKSVRKMSGKRPDTNRTKSGPEERREEKRRDKQTNKSTCDGERVPEEFRASEAFMAAWSAWKSYKQERLEPVNAIVGEAQLQNLLQFTPEEAAEVIWFTIDRQAKGLITNGDHRGRPAAGAGTKGRKQLPSFEEGILK